MSESEEYLKRLTSRLQCRPETFADEQEWRRFAVLVPLERHADGLHLRLITRAHTLAIQPGEVAFPGGGIEPEDENQRAAAVRETCEELGVRPQDIRVLGELGVMPLPFRLAIHSVVAELSAEQLNLSPDEVADTFTVPLSFFRENPPENHPVKIVVETGEDFPHELIHTGGPYPFRRGQYDVLFWRYEGRWIWGITARIIRALLEEGI